MGSVIPFPVERMRAPRPESREREAADTVRLDGPDAYKAPFTRILSQMSGMAMDRNGSRVLSMRQFLHFYRRIAEFFPDDTMCISDVLGMHGVDFSNAEIGINIWADVHIGCGDQIFTMKNNEYYARRAEVRRMRERYAAMVDDLRGVDVKNYRQYVDNMMLSKISNSGIIMGTILEESFVDYREFLHGLMDFFGTVGEGIEPADRAAALRSVVTEMVKMCLNGGNGKTFA